jgi:hypothetical protein
MDIQAALRDGYSKQEIMAELGKRTGMKYESAIADGYSEDEVLLELGKRDIGTISNESKEKSVGGLVWNAAKDTWTLGKGIVQLLGTSPIDVASGIGKLAVGGSAALQKKMGIIPEGTKVEGEEAARQIAAPFVKAAREPSGIPGQIVDYAYEKPVSAAMNLSTGLGIAGKAAEAGNLARMASVLSKGSELTNPVAGTVKVMKQMSPAGRLITKGLKETIGATTGAGPGAVEEALKGNQSFVKAMRGDITGEEIVENAKQALNVIKDKRATDYQSRLANITNNTTNIDIAPIRQNLKNLLSAYNVKLNIDPSTGETIVDTSRVAMGHKGIKDIEGIIKEIDGWGNQSGDLSAVGLDTLKRRLADFYSDSSQARQFVASMENSVKNTISRAVPEYGQMTKGYREATSLIKDIESGLMMRKQGMTGRITADQTLRRLSSAMRENFEMRRELVDVLGAKSGQDIAGEVAGHAMNPIFPRGFVGKVAGGSTGYMVYLHPKLWPVLAASSPRVMGEFLNVYGNSLRQVSAVEKAVTKPAVANTLFQSQQIAPEAGMMNEQN